MIPEDSTRQVYYGDWAHCDGRGEGFSGWPTDKPRLWWVPYAAGDGGEFRYWED